MKEPGLWGVVLTRGIVHIHWVHGEDGWYAVRRCTYVIIDWENLSKLNPIPIREGLAG